MQPLVLARLPDRLDAKHPRIIEDLLSIAKDGHIEALKAMIEMLDDFYQNGRDSRHVEKFMGFPIWELKTASRGGTKGGARIYFFFTDTNEAVLVNAEVKSGNSPSQTKIKEVLKVYKALEAGILVLERGKKT
jgi:Phage derived protein Gp49-like (DUF891)